MKRVRARAGGQPDPELLALDAVNPAVPRDVAAVVHAAVELDARRRLPVPSACIRRELMGAIGGCHGNIPTDERPWLVALGACPSTNPAAEARPGGAFSRHDDDTVQEASLTCYDMLERLTIDTFSPLLGDAFTLHLDSTRTMATELTEVTDLSNDGHDATRGPADSVFDRVPERVERGVAAGNLPPGACQPGQLRALSGTIGPDAVGMRYEAVFT